MSDAAAPQCLHSWPDRNTIRVHVCIVREAHVGHVCGACGVEEPK